MLKIQLLYHIYRLLVLFSEVNMLELILSYKGFSGLMGVTIDWLNDEGTVWHSRWADTTLGHAKRSPGILSHNLGVLLFVVIACKLVAGANRNSEEGRTTFDCITDGNSQHEKSSFELLSLSPGILTKGFCDEVLEHIESGFDGTEDGTSKLSPFTWFLGIFSIELLVVLVVVSACRFEEDDNGTSEKSGA